MTLPLIRVSPRHRMGLRVPVQWGLGICGAGPTPTESTHETYLSPGGWTTGWSAGPRTLTGVVEVGARPCGAGGGVVTSGTTAAYRVDQVPSPCLVSHSSRVGPRAVGRVEEERRGPEGGP